jgi:hypothetical protein
VTSDAAIERNPERLKRFVRALSRGFDAAEGDPAAATQALREAWQGAPAEAVVDTQVRLSNQTFPVIAGKPRGFIEDEVISSALNLLVESEQIKETKPLGVYFTNSLITN